MKSEGATRFTGFNFNKTKNIRRHSQNSEILYI